MNKLFTSFLGNKFLSRWVVLLLDSLIVISSAVVSFSIVQQVYRNLHVVHPPFLIFVYLIFGFNFLSFLIFKTYKGIIRYSTIYEMQRIFIAILMANLLIFVTLHDSYLLHSSFLHIPGSVTLTYCAIILLSSAIMLLGLRFFIVITYQRILPSLENGGSKKIPVYIFGTKLESATLKDSIAHGRYKVVGFISFDKNDISKRIANSPIIYINRDHLEDMRKYSVNAILFPNESHLRDKKLVEKLLAKKIKVYVAPQLKDFEDIEDPANKLIRPIQIEDLLGRDEIAINLQAIAENIEGRNVLVTGAAGSIGSEIVRQLAQFKPKLMICLDQAETPLNDLELELKKKYPKLNFITLIADVRTEDRMTMVFARYTPDVVYHAAAYKHVPMMEKNPCEAILANVMGTKRVVDLSIKYGVQMFVMISTDKAVNPTNIMGASKRLAEIYVQSIANTAKARESKIKLVTTRFGNVLGSNGSVIPLFRRQIEQGGPVTVTDPKITRYFMTIPEACRLVLEASVIGNTGYIYVFDMGEPVKIIDLAHKMIELAGLIPMTDIDIKFSGLRPGEKLYEELLNDGETSIPTQHKKVMIAKVREYEYNEIEPLIEELILVAKRVDIQKTVILMKNIVPEFISKNSIFEKFDTTNT